MSLVADSKELIITVMEQLKANRRTPNGATS
jgi:hypothetical protein